MMHIKLISLALGLCLFYSESMSGIKVERADMFHYVAGVNERDFDAEWASDSFWGRSINDVKLYNKQTGRSYRCGRLSLHTLKSLRAESVKKPLGGGSFALLRNTPVERLMADPAYYGAIFQVAARPNALEGGGSPNSWCINPINHSLVADGQGERVGRCVLPSYIARVHEQLVDTNYTPGFGTKLFKGYPEVAVGAYGHLGKVPQCTTRTLEEQQVFVQYTDAMQVAFVDWAQVVFGEDGSVVEPEQLVSLALCSPVALYADDDRAGGCGVFAQIALQAMMEATLRLADLHDCAHVVLTPLGSGLSNNDVAWLCSAIAAQRELIKQFGLRVELALDDDKNLEHYQALEAYMNGTAGTYSPPNNAGSLSAPTEVFKRPLPERCGGLGATELVILGAMGFSVACFSYLVINAIAEGLNS